MSDLVDIASRRVARSQDNSELTPKDILRAALSDIESGEEAPTAVLVLTLTKGDDKKYDRSWYAANLSSTEMMALMEMIKMDLYAAMTGQ